MRLPLIKRLSTQDLGSEEIPSHIDKLLSILNGFIDPVANALQNRLTFSDNFYCKMVTQKLDHEKELKISVSSAKIIGVIPLKVSGSLDTNKMLTGFGFESYGKGQIGIKASFKGGASTTAEVTLVIFLG